MSIVHRQHQLILTETLKPILQERVSLVELVTESRWDDLLSLQDLDDQAEIFPELDAFLEDCIQFLFFDVELCKDRPFKATSVGLVKGDSEQGALENEANDRRLLFFQSYLFDCTLIFSDSDLAESF